MVSTLGKTEDDARRDKGPEVIRAEVLVGNLLRVHLSAGL